ncbi:PspC domain-containing protein [Nocardioides montaniterrae]
MTTPPNGTSTEEPQASGPAEPGQGPRVTGDQMRDLSRMRRNIGDRHLAGVAGGIARHFDIDPLVVRVALVVMVFFGGSGVLLYGAGWLLIPEEGTRRAIIPLDSRTRNVALWIASGLAALSALGDSVGQWHFPWPVVVIGLIVLFVLSKTQHGRRFGQDWTPEQKREYAEQVKADVHARVDQRIQAKMERINAKIENRYAETDRYLRPPRDPRRRGPVLFGFTLALCALVVGTLITAHLAGAHIVPSAYPASVAAVCGVMLLVSAWYGRGGGLLVVGIAALVATLFASTTGGWTIGRESVHPADAASVSDRYRIGIGEYDLDLSDVQDLSALDGRTIDLVGRVGHLIVTLPATGLDVTAYGQIKGAGETIGFGNSHRDSSTYTLDGGTNVPRLTIDAQLTFGQIEFRTEEKR